MGYILLIENLSVRGLLKNFNFTIPQILSSENLNNFYDTRLLILFNFVMFCNQYLRNNC